MCFVSFVWNWWCDKISAGCELLGWDGAGWEVKFGFGDFSRVLGSEVISGCVRLGEKSWKRTSHAENVLQIAGQPINWVRGVCSEFFNSKMYLKQGKNVPCGKLA